VNFHLYTLFGVINSTRTGENAQMRAVFDYLKTCPLKSAVPCDMVQEKREAL